MLSECFSDHKQHFNLFLNFPEEVTCYIRNPKQCFPSPNKIYSSANKTKIASIFFSYELTCNLFLPVFWTLSELAAGRPGNTFWDYFFYEENVYSWLLYISSIFIFKSAGFSAENRTLLFSPFYRRTYLYSNSGRLPFGECGSSRSKVATCAIGAVVCILALAQEPEVWALACFWIEEPLTFWVLIQALPKSIFLPHTAFPVKYPPSAPAPALAAMFLWSESTGQCNGMKEEFSSMALVSWERDKR